MIPPYMKKWYRSINPIPPGWKEWITPQFAALFNLNKIDISFLVHPKFEQPGRERRYEALFFSGYPASINAFNKIARDHGMDYRFPFFDRRIVEFILGLPANQIFLPGCSRKILRESMTGKIPEPVRTRQSKTGLFDLYDKGIYERNWSQIEKVFNHSQVVERGWIRRDWLTSETSQQRRTGDGFIFWLVLNLEMWLQKYWAR